MSPGLVFITQTGPTKCKDQQSLIRKHVMKDIGKSRRKEKKIETNSFHFSLEIPDSFSFAQSEQNIDGSYESQNPPLAESGTLETLSTEAPSFSHDISLQVIPKWWIDTIRRPYLHSTQLDFQAPGVANPRIERLWTGRMDPFVRYPIKMNRRTLQLMDHLFDDRYGNTPPFRNAWLPVGMMNPASFHQVLSNAAINLSFLRGIRGATEQKESILHHTTALNIAAKQIADPATSTSDGVLGAVLGFACYSHVTGRQNKWQMHMNAAKEIVRARGGLETLHSHPLLRIIMFWIDVCGAVTEDMPPNFPIPTSIIPPQAVPEGLKESVLMRQVSNSWNALYPGRSEIMTIMDDIRSYSFALDQEAAQTSGKIFSDGQHAAYGVLPILHRILCLSSDITTDYQQKLDIVRLGCLLHFSEIKRRFGIMGIVSSYQTRKLSSLLEQQTNDWGFLEILKAWVLAFAFIESSGAQRIWFFQELQISKRRLKIESWEELRNKFRDISWYDSLHSPMLEGAVKEAEDLDRGGPRFKDRYR